MALALTLSGCSLSKDQPPAPAGQADPGPTNPGTAAGFTAETISGDAVTIPDGRPSVVLFFSVECGGCGPTANALAQAQADNPDAADYAVVDVAGYETVQDIQGFLEAYDAGALGYAIDAEGDLVAEYQVTQLSTVLILDADNQVTFRAIEPSADQIRAELAKVTGS